jgi:L-ascorbate metabolism protein UlaG (beta-lactamase superfamily)
MPRYAAQRLERVTASKQYRDGSFHNPNGIRPDLKKLDDSPRLNIIGDFLFGGSKRRPPGVVPVESPLEAWSRSAQTDLRLTWLGHSTLLLESGRLKVLTDPVFGARVSPVSFAGPKRFHPVPATIAELPELDAVLVSHDHLDHLCAPSIRQLAALRVPFVTSLGVGHHLEQLGVQPALITELDWWEGARVGGVLFHSVPAQHFSGRSLTDRNETLWSSWVIETDRHRLFFSGDTGYHHGLSAIRERFGAFDVTMLEIGAWHPAWGDIHLGPENALRALQALGGGTLLPVHWGTFDLGLHTWSEPAETLLALAKSSGAHVLTPRLGRPFEPAHADAPSPWWRAVGDRELTHVGVESAAREG